MLVVAADRGRQTAPPAALLWRQRFRAGRPQAGRGLDADGIGQTHFGDAVAEIGVVAVSRVGQNDFGVDFGRQSGTKLVKRDLRPGLEDGDACLGAPGRVVGPLAHRRKHGCVRPFGFATR